MGFASDTFTGTANTELSAYNSAWSKQFSYTFDAFLGTASGTYVHARGAEYSVYQHSGTPASADYSVFAEFALYPDGATGGTGPRIGVIGRAASGAADYYLVMYTHDTTQYRLFRSNGGSLTQLGSAYSHTLTTTREAVELRMSGNDISVYIDSTLRIGPVTDGSPITAAGKAGILLREMRQTGVGDCALLDNFDAVDAGGGGSSTGAAAHYYRQLQG